MGFSWQASQAQHGRCNISYLRRQSLLIAQIRQEEMATRGVETEIVDVQNPKTKAYFGPDRIQVRVECLLRDGEVGDPHRDHTTAAPYEKCERLLQRNNFQSAAIRQVIVGGKRFDGWVDQHFELRQLRMEPILYRRGELLGEFQLVCGIHLGLHLDRLDGRPAESQSIHPHTVLASLHSLNLERASE